MSVHTSYRDVSEESIRKKKVRTLSVPYRDLNYLEALACGFQADLHVAEKHLSWQGCVSTGLPFGHDTIIIEWGEHLCVVFARDLLSVWQQRIHADSAGTPRRI